jgi:hypothetical protein
VYSHYSYKLNIDISHRKLLINEREHPQRCIRSNLNVKTLDLLNKIKLNSGISPNIKVKCTGLLLATYLETSRLNHNPYTDYYDKFFSVSLKPRGKYNDSIGSPCYLSPRYPFPHIQSQTFYEKIKKKIPCNTKLREHKISYIHVYSITVCIDWTDDCLVSTLCNRQVKKEPLFSSPQ